MPTKKAASKKTAPKPKLIEGKYSHKFLTRLEPAEGEQLTELMKITQNKTYTGAIKHVLNDYSRVVEQLKETRERLQVSEINLSQYKRRIEAFTSAFKGLSDYKPVDKVQTSIFDLTDDDECPTCGETLEHGLCPNCDD